MAPPARRELAGAYRATARGNGRKPFCCDDRERFLQRLSETCLPPLRAPRENRT